MISEKMKKEMSGQDIAQLLKDNCYKSEIQPVRKNFTEDELEQMRLELTELSIKRHELEEELKAIKKEYSEPIKEHTVVINANLKHLKNGYVENDEPVYLMADHDKGLMHYYTEAGDLMFERKLLPNERQGQLFNIKKQD